MAQMISENSYPYSLTLNGDTITTSKVFKFENNVTYVENWETILEKCPYEDLKKEFRKRNLAKLLEKE